MSRSLRSRHNKYGINMKLWGGDSDKKDKQKANRKFRRYSKMHAKMSILYFYIKKNNTTLVYYMN